MREFRELEGSDVLRCLRPVADATRDLHLRGRVIRQVVRVLTARQLAQITLASSARGLAWRVMKSALSRMYGWTTTDGDAHARHTTPRRGDRSSSGIAEIGRASCRE